MLSCEPIIPLSYKTFYSSGNDIMIYKELSAAQTKASKNLLKAPCRRVGRLDWFMGSYWNRAQRGVCARPRHRSDIIISAMTERTFFISFLYFFVARRPCELFAFLNTLSEPYCLFCFANMRSVGAHVYMPKNVWARRHVLYEKNRLISKVMHVQMAVLWHAAR